MGLATYDENELTMYMRLSIGYHLESKRIDWDLFWIYLK